MDASQLEDLARQVAAGTMEPQELARLVRLDSVAHLGYAQIDLDRGVRTGVSEVIYGAGKTAEQIAGILNTMVERGEQRVLVTRLDARKAQDVCAAGCDVHYDPVARIGILGTLPTPTGNGTILILTAGTSDAPVAAEAELTARFLGNEVVRINDVGVAGIHRLLAHGSEIAQAQVIIAVAGMEGALPSVVAGLAACPVIAVPTSVGYGAHLGGVTALLAMVNSCASGVSVVNIDNGFGAAYQASLINHLSA